MAEITTSVKSELKYKILELLNMKRYTDRNALRSAIITKAGISRQTFWKYCNIPADGKSDIPGSILMVFASVLKVPMQDLFNESK